MYVKSFLEKLNGVKVPCDYNLQCAMGVEAYIEKIVTFCMTTG